MGIWIDDVASTVSRIAQRATICAFACATAFSVQMGIGAAYADSPTEEGPTRTPLNAASAQKIADGQITFGRGIDDSSLLNQDPLDPNADPDQDGLTNAQEVYTYEKDGVTYYGYNSHPLLADTDGDGIADADDKEPLRWNVSTRDAVIGQELVYRDDSYIDRVLDYTRPLADNELYRSDREQQGRLEYRLMNREWGPYWEVDSTYHNANSGFDAVLFKFSTKKFPFLEEGTYILAIRGTAGRTDINNDLALALGSWPEQTTDAKDLADRIWARRDDITNLYVTGHSLGGYLTQVFLVRSLGGYYGDPANGFTTNDELYWEKDKLYNTNIKGAYTFNAPKIVANHFRPALKEYARTSEIITKKFGTKHYVVNNDSVTTATGAPPGYIPLEASSQGHSSRSFFESRYTDLYDFSVGKRRDLSGEGYQDPNVANVNFYKVTTLNYVDPSGKKLSSQKMAVSEEEFTDIRPDAYLPDNYELATDELTLKYGDENDIPVRGIPLKVTYRFDVHDSDNTPVDLSSLPAEEQKSLADQVIDTRYGQSYTLPDPPASPSVDYRYELVSPDEWKAIPSDELTANREIVVHIRRLEEKQVTTITLKDESGTTIETLTYETKPSESNSVLVLDASRLPKFFELAPDQDLHFTPGSNPTFIIRPKMFTVTMKYMDADKEIASQQILVRAGEKPVPDFDALSDNVKEKYRLIADQEFEPVDKDQQIIVKVEAKPTSTPSPSPSETSTSSGSPTPSASETTTSPAETPSTTPNETNTPTQPTTPTDIQPSQTGTPTITTSPTTSTTPSGSQTPSASERATSAPASSEQSTSDGSPSQPNIPSSNVTSAPSSVTDTTSQTSSTNRHTSASKRPTALPHTGMSASRYAILGSLCFMGAIGAGALTRRKDIASQR